MGLVGLGGVGLRCVGWGGAVWGGAGWRLPHGCGAPRNRRGLKAMLQIKKLLTGESIGFSLRSRD